MPDIRDVINETYLRTERTRPTGSRTADRNIQYFAEVFGLEDAARLDERSIPIVDNLVSWWSLDTASISGATAKDWWGSNGSYYNHGAMTGLVASSLGKIRESLTWGDPGDQLLVSDHSSIQNLWNSGASFECWLNLTYDASSDFLVSKGSWIVYHVGAFPTMVFRIQKYFSTTNGVWQVSPGNALYGRWLHLVVTYNAGSVSNDPVVYLNGVSQHVTETQTPVGTSVTDVGSDLIIGSDSGGLTPANGLLDEVRYYGDILNSVEVTHNFNTVRRMPLGSFYPGEEVAI